jgi:hypothetical protein
MFMAIVFGFILRRPSIACASVQEFTPYSAVDTNEHRDDMGSSWSFQCRIHHCPSENGVTSSASHLSTFHGPNFGKLAACELLLNNFLQLRELCFKHQMQALLYRQQITLGQVHVLLDNGMRTFRQRCHTHTQVYVVICKICNIMHLIRHPCFSIYDTNPSCSFWAGQDTLVHVPLPKGLQQFWNEETVNLDCASFKHC